VLHTWLAKWASPATGDNLDPLAGYLVRSLWDAGAWRGGRSSPFSAQEALSPTLPRCCNDGGCACELFVQAYSHHGSDVALLQQCAHIIELAGVEIAMAAKFPGLDRAWPLSVNSFSLSHSPHFLVHFPHSLSFSSNFFPSLLSPQIELLKCTRICFKHFSAVCTETHSTSHGV